MTPDSLDEVTLFVQVDFDFVRSSERGALLTSSNTGPADDDGQSMYNESPGRTSMWKRSLQQ